LIAVRDSINLAALAKRGPFDSPYRICRRKSRPLVTLGSQRDLRAVTGRLASRGNRSISLYLLVGRSHAKRLGRTARAGAHGTAVSLVTETEAGLIRRYEQDLGISLQCIRLRNGEISPASIPH
jgi:hypothetical protein